MTDDPPTPPPPPPSRDRKAVEPPPVRDRIVVIGRRYSGKSVYLSRLYEAMWQGCTLVDGRALMPGEDPAGRPLSTISCRATTGPAHANFMTMAEELRRGRWPASTQSMSYAEIMVSHGGREHVMTTIDYPGEVFRRAFMEESMEADAAELRGAIDRAAAAIMLIDPEVVARGGSEAQEDAFGLTQAAARIRASAGGELVPIAIVFTKCDVAKPLLRESGGVRAFAERHFSQLFRGAQRTAVFACAAVRCMQDSLGRSVPRADKPPENVIEPLRYCIEQMERGVDIRRAQEASARRREAERQVEERHAAETRKSATAWVMFAVAAAMLLAAAGIGTFWFLMRNG